jgi:hypothetical protein
MSVDPAGGEPTEPQSWNRYSYTLNNPLRYVDPDGEAAVNVQKIISLNSQIRNKLGFVPNFILDLLLPADAESLVASSLPGPQALGTGVVSKSVAKSVINRVSEGRFNATSLAAKVYYYTDAATAKLIQRSQVGLPSKITYLTSEGNLTPLQAQIELSLPQKNTSEALFEISTEGLDKSKIILQRRVTGNILNRAGGGTEILYNGTIPIEKVRRIR